MAAAKLSRNARLARPRVEGPLRDAVRSVPLTLVHAPLGAGKSTALRAALAEESGLAWMEAKPWHRKAFIEPIVDAVRDVRPDFGRLTLGAASAGASATHLGRIFAQELGHVNAPLTLVIDDAHIFSGESAFARFIAGTLRDVPENVRILLAGRTLPEVPLAEYIARGHAKMIGGSIFAFDTAEIASLATALGSSVDNETIDRIAAASDGWAAGVVLALRAGHAVVPTTYLADRLLPALTPSLVTFLEEASVLDTLQFDVLQHIKGMENAEKTVAQLQREGALVNELAPTHVRLNPVLRELVSTRLEARGGTSAAHARAAEGYALVGNIGAALFHVEASKDAAAAARFLRSHVEAAIATGDRARVRVVASRIDSKGDSADVRWYADGLLAKAQGSKETRARFERAALAAEQSGNSAIAFAARAQVVEHDIGRLSTIEGAALEDLTVRAEALDTRAVVTAAILAGWAAAIDHDFAGALASVAPFLEVGDAAARFNTGILHAYVRTTLGEFDAAEETLNALVRLLEDDDRVVLQTLTLVWLSRLALTWGRTTIAADAANQALRLSQQLDLRSEEAALFVVLAEIATHHGDIQAAVAFAERARERAEHAWYIADVARVQAFAQIALARAAFLGHDNAIAYDLSVRAANAPTTPAVQRAVALSEAAVYALLKGATASPDIERARTAVLSASPIDAADAAALATADDVLAFLDAANGAPHESQPRSGEPFSHLIDGRRGLVTLEHAGVAVASARTGKSGDTAFATAIERLTRDGGRFEARLARAYASSFVKAQPQAAAAAASIDLTARELEILALLVDGLTNKEIAQRLILSPRTVETHVERVLGKLQAGSRSRAIAIALRLGIVAL